MEIASNPRRNFSKTDIEVRKFCRDFSSYNLRIQRRWKHSAVGNVSWSYILSTFKIHEIAWNNGCIILFCSFKTEHGLEIDQLWPFWKGANCTIKAFAPISFIPLCISLASSKKLQKFANFYLISKLLGIASGDVPNFNEVVIFGHATCDNKTL